MAAWRARLDWIAVKQRACLLLEAAAQRAEVRLTRRCLATWLSVVGRLAQIMLAEGRHEAVCRALEETETSHRKSIVHRIFCSRAARMQRGAWRALPQAQQQQSARYTRLAWLLGSLCRSQQRRVLDAWRRGVLAAALKVAERGRGNAMDALTVSNRAYGSSQLAHCLAQAQVRHAGSAMRGRFGRWRESALLRGDRRMALATITNRYYRSVVHFGWHTWCSAARQIRCRSAGARHVFVILRWQIEHRCRTALRQWCLIATLAGQVDRATQQAQKLQVMYDGAAGAANAAIHHHHYFLVRRLVCVASMWCKRAAVQHWCMAAAASQIHFQVCYQFAVLQHSFFLFFFVVVVA